MRNSRIFMERPVAAHSEIGVEGEAWHYLAHVLRVRPGQPVTLFDGRGGEYAAEVAELGKKSLLLRVGAHDPVERESPLDLTLAQGVSRPEHMDYTVQKAVELGARRIAPVLCERGPRLDAERLDKRRRHWTGIARSACEQCGRNRVPEVLPARPLAEWLADGARGPRLLLAPEGAAGLAQLPAPTGPLHVLAGPEGGFSAAETAAAIRAGCLPVRLGPRVLRTETAGLAALAVCQSLWGDWG